jgi:two-component system CheB/CheR fusion protein
VSRYGPAGVVVDQTLRIIEHRGEMEPFLAEPYARPEGDLMSVIRPELRATVGTAIEEARRLNATAEVENSDADGIPVTVTVVPFILTGTPQHFLILFAQLFETGGARRPLEGSPEAEAGEQTSRLQQELKSTREYLQAVIEELRSTNEEAQSANEELQSTNEEMQTSKEELQSANEELNTINAEMQSRNVDLARLNDDLINLLGSMNMPIVMTGSDLRIRRFTPMAEKVLRLISTDVGRPIADLKPRINVANLEDILRQVVDTLEPREQEVHDEEGRQYLMRVRAYRTADHRIDGTVLQLVDVSELKRSMEQVRQARDYAESVVNTVREPLVVLDRTCTIRDVNSAFHASFGIPESAALGRSIFEVARGVFDLPEVRRMLEQLNRNASEFNDLEIKHRPDGETRILLLNARRLRTGDGKELILMAIEDITDRKRAAEARYRRLFESARDGILLVDAATGEVLDANPYTERLFGYRHGELVGRKLWEIEPLQNVSWARAVLDQIRDRGVERFDDLNLRTRDGRDIQTEVIANVYTEGERLAIQFNMRDVSERRKFERELRETQKLESLGLLAGGIAHDFNNLLTGIIGNASLAYTEVAPDQPLRMRLREIVQAGERAAFLTRQMLAYSGRGRFVIEPIDLGDLIREISALVRSSIPKTVELKLNLAPNLPLVEGDAAQIQQVIMNLVINAGEAIGEDGTGTVEVRTTRREIDAREAAEFFGAEQPARGPYVQIEVIDNGAGMDDETKARIFDPFFTTKFTGRGLGLAAVQGIVKGHHGAIRVHSTLGQGTSFLILLPAARRRKAAVHAEERPAASIPLGSVALVIDDEETIRELTRNVLLRAGMKVLLAENGQEGVEVFRENKGLVSVVILDLLMPSMGGEEVINVLKQIDPEVPVILSSGFDEREVTRRFVKHKPTRFLHKPYTAERLVEAVASTLNHRQE